MPRKWAKTSRRKILWYKFFGKEAGQWLWQGQYISRRKSVSRILLSVDRAEPQRLWLEEIETEPGFRKQGYAKQLMQNMMATFCFHDFRDIRLVIRPFGQTATMNQEDLASFYEQFGFVKTDRLVCNRSVWLAPLANPEE